MRDIVEIYVPLDVSNLREIIPEGEDIIYSTFCKGYNYIGGTEYRWLSHVLITENYVAFQEPDYYSRKSPLKNKYVYWDEIQKVKKLGKLAGFMIDKHFGYTITRDERFETKEQFKKRLKEFVPKFKPYVD
ncbi:MAG: hypothetical protein ACFFBP_06570 [Promethearchaeota archaeon]